MNVTHRAVNGLYFQGQVKVRGDIYYLPQSTLGIVGGANVRIRLRNQCQAPNQDQE